MLPSTFAMLATYNPVTYVIEGTRALVLSGWNDPAIWQGFIVSAILFVVMVTLTVQSFRRALK